MFRVNYFLVILGCAVLSTTFVNGDPAKVHVLSVDIEAVDKEFLDIKVKLTNSSGESLIDVDCEVLKDLGSDLFTQVHIQKKQNDELITLFKSDVIDRCHFVDNREKYPILKLLFADFDDHGNLLKSCPVTKGQYTMRGYKFIPRGKLEDLIKPGEYVVHMLLMKEIDTQMRTLYSIRSRSLAEAK